MSQDAISISVVICTYNRAAYIWDAMESLVNQTLDKTAFEVIIVNNNSTDDTKKICLDYLEAHPDYQFHFLNEAKQGASFARNTGAALAKGEIAMFYG